jgi:hypothetical protein
LRHWQLLHYCQAAQDGRRIIILPMITTIRPIHNIRIRPVQSTRPVRRNTAAALIRTGTPPIHTGIVAVRISGSNFETKTSPPPELDPCIRGGIFSAAWRSLQNVGAQDPQLVSVTGRPQIQLMPSTSPVLPAQARLGEMYFVMSFERSGNLVGPMIGQLCICAQIHGTTPIWQHVMLRSALQGGNTIPQG